MVVNLRYSRTFSKHFAQRIKKNVMLSRAFDKRIEMFIANPEHPLLRTHPLKGLKKGLVAFSVTGDVRVLYHIIDASTVEFADIGTHAQVYG